jgi:putative oxidoreductase
MANETTAPAIAPSPRVSHWATGGLTVVGLLAAIYAATQPGIPVLAKASMIVWLALSVALTVWLTPRNFIAGYLTGLGSMLVGWRVAGLDGVNVVAWSLLPAFAAFVAQFFDCARVNLRSVGIVAWQLTFVRIYVGFDMVPHFTEKLFAGPTAFDGDLSAFSGFGLPEPTAWVIVAGFCELGTAIGIGLGLLTRLAGICAALYFLIATLVGGHFSNGFIWASTGGGWEYPVLMMVLFLTYSATGAGPFSLDRVLRERSLIPDFARRFATSLW